MPVPFGSFACVWYRASVAGVGPPSQFLRGAPRNPFPDLVAPRRVFVVGPLGYQVVAFPPPRPR
eukprot:1298953-Lingulodinium_polyedra.AAC.1